ncbi:MAG: DUF4214 domain-containing protein, partial [Betaproteobacteria bacterium]|nr:DUF4214 domain-containing protein [Betaproteobacteria bacterium]
VYQNLFGRAPETEGWNYWEAQMNAGWVTIGNAAYEILGGAQGTDLTTITYKTTAAQVFTDGLETQAEIESYARAGDNGVGHLAKEWLATVSHTIESLEAALRDGNNLLTALVDANNGTIPLPPPIEDNLLIIDPSYDYTVTATHPFGPTGNKEYNTLKWNGGFGNGTVTVYDWTSADCLDFTAYGAILLGMNHIGENPHLGEINYGPLQYIEVPTGWYGNYSGGRHDVNAGEKYITLTNIVEYIELDDYTTPRVYPASTVYKIELWTIVGNTTDAYYRGYLENVGFPNELLDTAELIGYLDLVYDPVFEGVYINFDY